MRRITALIGGLALAIPGCAADPPIETSDGLQAIGTPPGSSNEAVFPFEYGDIVPGRGIRTVTSSRTAGPCVKLPDGVRYEVANREWISEGTAVANQTEFARKFKLDATVAIEHGDASGNLGLTALRELDWKASSLKLVIRVLYTYDVFVSRPDDAELTQAAYDTIAPPAMGDTQALRDARARAFLKTCGRYWAKGAKKGAELLIVYSLHNVRLDRHGTLNATVSASVPAAASAPGTIKAEEQAAFKNAIQGATLKVYSRGFRVNAGDPVTPITQAMDPAGNNQLTSLAGFFNDLKESLNRNFDADAAPTANPVASNVDARKIAMLGQYYQPLFRTPRSGANATLATWAPQAQTDLFNQDNALYTTVSQYTTFLNAADSAERMSNHIRGLASNGAWNFETRPEYTIAAVQSRMDALKETVRVARNVLGPLQRNVGGGLNTDAQETGYWARRCWDLIVQGNESDPCYTTADFYNRAQTALTAFRNGVARPLNFFSVTYTYDIALGWIGPFKADDKWNIAEGYCNHVRSSKKIPLGLKLPSSDELYAFGAFLSGTPSHLPGIAGMELRKKFLWNSGKFVADEWTQKEWVTHSFGEGWGRKPDMPYACILQAGPFAMPIIMF